MSISFTENINLTINCDTIFIDLDMVTGLDHIFVDSDVKVIFNQRPLVSISPSGYLSDYNMSIGTLARNLGLTPKESSNDNKVKSFQWFTLLNKLFRL